MSKEFEESAKESCWQAVSDKAAAAIKVNFLIVKSFESPDHFVYVSRPDFFNI
jgi:hypothetical protein